MTMQLASSKDLGLQHVLENGLALMRHQPLDDEARRIQVLDNLIQIFSEADRGSQALRSQNLLFAVEQRPEFERFALFFHYLEDTFGADLPSRLTEAAAVLIELRNGPVDDETKRGRAAELIESLLTALRQERALSPLNPPRVYHYG